MAFATLNYYSRSLEKASSLNVIFPDEPGAEPWAALYLLHGLSDDHTTWMRRTCIERYVLGMPLVVVMPDGGRGWYTNSPDGDLYEDHLLVDTVRLIERSFPVQKERSGRAIGGLSMGGYGALKFGLKHPEMFVSVNSQSGTLAFMRNPFELHAPSREVREFRRIFGDHPEDGPEDLWPLARGVDRERLPALHLDCGDEDPFLLQNRAFHTHLESLSIRHAYVENPGTHDWQYWDRHVRAALEVHARHLGLPGRFNQ